MWQKSAECKVFKASWECSVLQELQYMLKGNQLLADSLIHTEIIITFTTPWPITGVL